MRIRALVLRIVRQLLHDRRTLALMFIAPLLIMTLVSFIFNGDTYKPKLGLVDVPTAFSEKLTDAGAEVQSYSSADAEDALQRGDLDALVQLEGTTPNIQLEGSDPTKNKAVLMLVQKTMQTFQPQNATSAPTVSYLHGSEEMVAFDSFGPVLVGVIAFFLVFLIAGISFLRERTGGTLERLLASPLRKGEIVVGYTLGFGIFTALQSIFIVGYSVKVLGLMMNGSYGYLLLITLLLTLTALTLGILLSSYAANEFQMIQFIPIIIVPQVFFSGLFDLDTMAPWLRWLSNIMPLKYGADALRSIMIRGQGWSSIAMDAYVLAGLSLAFMLLNVLALRKHRQT
ncbi:ABC transporter permease [Gorillibacterium timonense]|uniref:ABC transporter permease n=1 Tax=Gorillibacterium timonense TaxID=1689269 RepID=UPI00071D0675|nr:ABC transporter permease [Gorillibacterium timonense]